MDDEEEEYQVINTKTAMKYLMELRRFWNSPACKDESVDVARQLELFSDLLTSKAEYKQMTLDQYWQK